jgi:anti-anti-sigma factor
MEIREEKSGEATNFRLKGRFTFADHAGFRVILSAMNGSGAKRVVVDLSELEFIDSAGMGMLLLANDTGKNSGTLLSLRGARGQVQKLFAGQKFFTVFAFED